MNIAIDPDVFRASFHNFECQVGINEIAREFMCYRFFRDDKGVLEQEYRKTFDENWEKNPEHPSVMLLKHILIEDGNHNVPSFVSLCYE